MKFRESQSIKSVKSKDTNYDQNYPKYKTTIRIVLRLCRDLLHQTFGVYTDTPAQNELRDFKTDIVGTLRQKRLDVPRDTKTPLLEKDRCIARYKDKIMLLM